MKKSIVTLALTMALAASISSFAFAEENTGTTSQETTDSSYDWQKWLDPEYYERGKMLDDISSYDWQKWVDYDWTKWTDTDNYDWTKWTDPDNYDWSEWKDYDWRKWTDEGNYDWQQWVNKDYSEYWS